MAKKNRRRVTPLGLRWVLVLLCTIVGWGHPSVAAAQQATRTSLPDGIELSIPAGMRELPAPTKAPGLVGEAAHVFIDGDKTWVWPWHT